MNGDPTKNNIVKYLLITCVIVFCLGLGYVWSQNNYNSQTSTPTPVVESNSTKTIPKGEEQVTEREEYRKVLVSDELSLVLPIGWVNMSEGLPFYGVSKDFKPFSRTDVNCINIAYAKSGSYISLDEYEEPVSTNLENPTNYSNFVLANKRTGLQESALVTLDDYPFAYQRIDLNECGSVIELITRKNSKIVKVTYNYSGEYGSEKQNIQAVLESIVLKK